MAQGHPSCCVVGAGPIGLWTALALRRAGYEVTLVDSGERGAGWASGGLLGAVYETVGRADVPNSLTQLAMKSAHMWRLALQSFSLAVIEQSLFVARTDAEFGDLKQKAVLAQQWDIFMEPVAVPQGFDGQAAWLLPEPAIDPRAALSALRAAGVDAGVKTGKGKALYVLPKGIELTDGTRIVADRTILAIGFGKGMLQDATAGLEVLVPVKGQICAVHAPHRPLAHVVRSGRIYLIPRGDQIVIGATSHPYEATTEVSDLVAHQALMREARSLWSGLGALPVVESFAGVRPATPDGLPLIGPLQSDNRVLLATGAYRNGWLLAPAIAQMILAHVTGDFGIVGERDTLQPFLPDRFAN